MAATVHKRARANRDLVEHYAYLAEAAGIETAERFLSSAEKSFGELARHPGMGALRWLCARLSWRDCANGR
jgi:toxin ParE1/3/4